MFGVISLPPLVLTRAFNPVSQHSATVKLTDLNIAISIIPDALDPHVVEQVNAVKFMTGLTCGPPDDATVERAKYYLQLIKSEPGKIFRVLKLVGGSITSAAAGVVADREKCSLSAKTWP